MQNNQKKMYFNSCEWNKKSLFAYLRNNITEGYKIVYHQNNIVGINITKMYVMHLLTMGIVKKLCYGTIPEVWDYYINQETDAQYFLFFNFNVPSSSSKSVYAILRRNFDGELVLDAVDKYHNEKCERDIETFYYCGITSNLNCHKQSLFNAIYRGLYPDLSKPNVKLTYGECRELERKVLKIR